MKWRVCCYKRLFRFLRCLSALGALRQRRVTPGRLVTMPQSSAINRSILLGMAIAVVSMVAAEPWSHKDPAKWTPKDVQRVLSDSPWAQSTGAVFSLAAEDPASAPVTPPPLPGPGGAPNTGVRWDGGVGRSRGADPTLNVLVRWNSALPVREALSRSSEGGQQPYVAEHATTDYIISVVGLVPAGRYQSVGRTERNSRSDDTVDARNPEEMLEGLMAASQLIPKGKATIRPDDAKLDGSTGTLYIFFPRTQPIGLDDKEVAFTTRFGALTIQKSFRLKDMNYQGKLAL